ILEQGGNRSVKELTTEAHRLKDVVIDGMIVPVADAAAQRAVQGGRHNIDAGFHQPTGQEQALAPGVAAITVAQPVVLQFQIESASCLRAANEIPGTPLKGVMRVLGGGIQSSTGLIESAHQPYTLIHARQAT